MAKTVAFRPAQPLEVKPKSVIYTPKRDDDHTKPFT